MLSQPVLLVFSDLGLEAEESRLAATVVLALSVFDIVCALEFRALWTAWSGEAGDFDFVASSVFFPFLHVGDWAGGCETSEGEEGELHVV